MLALILALALQDDLVKESDHELDAGAAVVVRTVVGKVRLVGTDAKTAHVRTVRRGRDRERVEMVVEADKGRLSVEARFPRDGGGVEIDIEIDIQVPRSAKTLEAKNVSGSLEVKDAKGDATLTTVSGPIRVDGLSGNLSAVSISGEVRLSRLAADKATVSLTSGRLEGALEGREIDLTSVSGDLSLDVTPRGEGWSVKSSSVSGDQKLRFAPAAGAKVDLKTLSGGLESDIELKDLKAGGRGDVDRRLRGVFGDGAGTVRVTSISGSVRLGRTGK